jgi:hypothetical protein
MPAIIIRWIKGLPRMPAKNNSFYTMNPGGTMYREKIIGPLKYPAQNLNGG